MSLRRSEIPVASPLYMTPARGRRPAAGLRMNGWRGRMCEQPTGKTVIVRQ